jgi:hypothetical protein
MCCSPATACRSTDRRRTLRAHRRLLLRPAAGQRQTRVIPIREEAPPQLAHCAVAGFQTVVSVPVMLQQRMLGEIDLFYRAPATLSDEERQHLLDALASHLAGAMEGLRAGALERESAVAEERGLLARELHDSIAQSLAFLKIQVGLMREALPPESRRWQRVLDELDAGVRESTADVRELLVHFRTRTNGEDICRRCAPRCRSSSTRPAWPPTSVEGQGLPLAARRAGAGAARGAGGAVERAQACRRTRGLARGAAGAAPGGRGARRRARLRRRGRAARTRCMSACASCASAPAHRRQVDVSTRCRAPAPASCWRCPARQEAAGGMTLGVPPHPLLVVDDHTLFRRGLTALLAWTRASRWSARPATPARPSAARPRCSPT